MLINKRLEEPFDKISKEDELPIISKAMVNYKLSPQFWKYAQKFINIDLINLKSIYNEKKSKNQNISKENLFNANYQNKYEININNNQTNTKENIYLFKDNISDKDNNKNYNIDNLDNINLKDLKKFAETLQKDLDEKEVIISYQKEEGLKLKKKIGKLEKQLSSLISQKNSI